MSDTVIEVENLSKRYRLGTIGRKTLKEDLNRFWAKARGKPDPTLKVGYESLNRYNSEYVWALNDINFTVRQGEILGVIGRNGAGKSTLLKILSRITAPTNGKITYKGRMGSLLEVGTGFHPELTGRENIYLNGTILGMKKAEVDRKLDEIINFAEMPEFIDTPVKRYSSGMTVKLAFAVAAHLEPEILIVDEVLAVGDVQFRKKCLGKMKDISHEGRTVIFVSHNMQSVNSLCTDAILLNKGCVEFHGAVDRCIDYYLSANSSGQDVSSFWQGSLVGDNIELTEFAISDNQSVIENDKFTTDSSLFVSLKVNMAGLFDKVRVGFDLYSGSGTLIFRSFHDDVSRVESSHQEKDSHKLSRKFLCEIPAGLLNEGSYHIEPRISTDNNTWLPADSIRANFNLYRIHNSGPNWDFHEVKDRPGFITPDFSWSGENLLTADK